MANLRKNKINQILFVMVDKTDFATIESGITKSMLSAAGTIKFFGANHKDSAFTSLTPATAVSLIHSGIFKQMLTAAECVYDIGMLNLHHASCADQNMLLEFTEIGSAVWGAPYSNYVVASTMGSALGHTASRLVSLQSDVISMLSTVSQLRVRAAYSTISDLGSQLSTEIWGSVKGASALSLLSQLRVRTNWSTASDLTSKIASRVWAANIDGASMASNIASAVWAHAVGTRVDSRLVKVQSTSSNANSVAIKILSGVQPSQLNSVMWYTAGYGGSNVMSQTIKLISRIGKSVATASFLSDFYSDFISKVPKAVATASGLSDARSSINSHVSGVAAATVSVSNISDIASAVWAYKMASQTGAGTCGSALNRTSNIWSLISDITSALAITATASDVASAVWAQKWDIHSLASTFGSRIAKWAESGINIRPSDMSSISNYAAAITDANMSNIASRVWSAKYTAHSVASSFGSLISDMYSRIVKTQSTSSNVNSKLVSFTGNMTSYISDIASRVWSEKWDVHSGASGFGSAFEVIKSRISALRVRAAYSTVSDMTSKISSRVWAQVDASDIASAVWAHAKGGSVLSYGAVAASGASLIPGMSNILSAVYVHTTSMHSQTSNINSKLGSFTGNMTSYISDIASRVWGEKWDVHSVASTFGSAFEWLLKRASYISDVSSKTYSMLTGASWMSNLGSVFWNDMSGMRAAASQTASVVWATPYSNFATASTMGSAIGRTKSNYSALSDVLSKIYVQTTSILSQTSDTQSNLASFIGNFASYASDIESRVWGASISTLKGVAGSFGSRYAKLTTSDALSKAQSSINSHVSGIAAATVTADNISDIASAVWAESISSLKGVAASFGSRFAKLTTSDTLSKAQSDISSHISKATSIVCSHVSGITASVDKVAVTSLVWAHAKATSTLAYGKVAASGASLIPGMSNILSAVYVQTTSMLSQTSNANSYLQSTVSSKISGLSNILSAVYVQTTSTVSAAQAVRSKVASFVTNYASYMSDISSRVWATAVGTAVVSRVSDMYSYLSDFNTHGIDLTASAISDIRSTLDACLDSAFTDATGLTPDSLKERIRRMDWILQNKMRVIKASGNTLIYKDDNATTGLSTAAALTSDATSVVRKRMV